MSKPRVLLSWALAAALAAPLPAQVRATALADSVAALEVRTRRARIVFDSVATGWRVGGEDTLVVAGATLRYPGNHLTDADRRRIVRSFEAVAAGLRTSLGTQGEALLAGTDWLVSVRPMMGVRPAAISLEALPQQRAGSAGFSMRSPLSEEVLVTLISQNVGDRLLRQSPPLARWIRSGLSLPAQDLHATALRSLNLTGNARSVRCARGSVEDCAVILDPARRNEWHAGTDDPTREWPPASDAVRASLLVYAAEHAGEGFIAAVTNPADSTLNPIALLAKAAKQSPEALLRDWSGTLAASGARAAALSPSLAISTALWVLVFGIVATRRRAA